MVSYQINRNEFFLLSGVWTGLFVLYFIVVNKLYQVRHYFLIGLSLAFFSRLLLLFSFPNLSDDFYRFIWDGMLINEGVHPFQFKPSEIIRENLLIGSDWVEELYINMNSPNYYTIYPTFCQGLFAFAGYCFPENLHSQLIFLKSFLFLFEIGTAYFLIQLFLDLNWSVRHALLYLLNPLVIIELVGNIHFEAAMICFVLGTVFFLQRQKLILAALFFAIAILFKLIPLMLLPIFCMYLGYKKGSIFTLVTLAFTAIGFWPIIPASNNFAIFESIKLYFQNFEFNAGIYYLLREIAYYFRGYNEIEIIGKVLFLITTISIIAISLFQRKGNINYLLKGIFLSYFVYYLLATVVHPWYIGSIIAFGIFAKLRTPIFWSWIIVISYYAYSQIPIQENLIFIMFEYMFLFLYLIRELLKYKGLMKHDVVTY